jgi:hypothetical protein
VLIRAIGNSLFNSRIGVLNIILPTQTMIMITNVKSIILLAQEPNANSIEVRSIKQKQFDDDVHTSPPKRNATIHGHVGTPTRKQHDSFVNKKRKKSCDENLDVAAKLTAYVTYKNKVISTQSVLIKD